MSIWAESKIDSGKNNQNFYIHFVGCLELFAQEDLFR